MKKVFSKFYFLVTVLVFLETVDTTGQSLCSTSASPIYTENQITVTTSIVYGSAIPAGGSTPEDLMYDMYSPPGSGTRYAVVLFSGGGFGNVNRTHMETYCMEFAKRGIVAFTCDYRTDNSSCETPNDCACDKKLLSMYRAVQDGRAAIRHIAHNAGNYALDKDHLFIGGQSAGSILGLFIAYYNQAEIDNALKGGFAALGGIDNSTNALTDTYSISATMNLWGLVFSSNNSVNMIGPGDAPLISFHGKEDSTCVFGKTSKVYCSFTGKLWAFGSKPITDRLKDLGICYEFYKDSNGKHGLSSSKSDYGLGEIPPTDVSVKKTYIIERAVCFFKSVMCNYCTEVKPKNFTDVVNSSCTDPSQKLNPHLPAISEISFVIENKILFVQSPEFRITAIAIYNLLGERVNYTKVNDYSAIIDAGELINEIYIAEVIHENGREVRKFFVQ